MYKFKDDDDKDKSNSEQKKKVIFEKEQRVQKQMEIGKKKILKRYYSHKILSFDDKLF